MARAGLRAFSSTVRLTLVALVGAVASAAGCGGQVLDGDPESGGGSAFAGGGTSGGGPGQGGSKSGGVGGGGSGGSRATGGRPAAGGAAASGGRPPSGGRPATGGWVASGAAPNAGGGPTMDPPTLCYAQGGVYFPGGGGCFLGSEATPACLRQAEPITRSCENRCACRACPSFYSRCLNDGGCSWILACAQPVGCRGVDACSGNGSCKFLIDRAGGPGSSGARLFDQYSECMVESRCSCDVL